MSVSPKSSMPRLNVRFLWGGGLCTIACLGALAGGCGQSESGVASGGLPITGQTIPGAQFTGRWSNSNGVGDGYLSLGLSGGNPDHVFWSYSTVRFEADPLLCSGTFIGPNVLLSAGHCGHVGFGGKPSGSFTALLYGEGSEHANETISATCNTLVQNIGLGDTHLVHCEDVPWFNEIIPPGQLLGMADIDPDPLSLSEDLWTTWWNRECPNPEEDGGDCFGPSQMIFSPGPVIDLPQGGGGQGVYGADGVITAQILAGGASGGAMWRQTAGSSHRLVSSGITNGPCSPATSGCGGFKAATIESALQVAEADSSGVGVNDALLQSLGLAGQGTPWVIADYQGLMDSDQDGFFDVQARLDDVDGIRSGSTVWLGFESPRRNRMWELNPAGQVSFNDTSLFASMHYTGAGDEVVMTMPKVALAPGETYRVSIMSLTEISPQAEGLTIELREQGAGTPVSTLQVTTPQTGDWAMFAGEVSAGSSVWHSVEVRVNPTEYRGSIAALTLIEWGSINSFDTHAERLNWRNNTTGDRAWILPYGATRPDGVDWAGLVNDQTAAVEDWSLRNRQLAIDPNRQYRVCFNVRSFPPGAGVGTGRVVLGSGASSTGTGEDPIPPDDVYVDETFALSDAWTRHCNSAPFQTQAGDNLLNFAHLAGEPEYLVDDVEITE